MPVFLDATAPDFEAAFYPPAADAKRGRQPRCGRDVASDHRGCTPATGCAVIDLRLNSTGSPGRPHPAHH